MIVRPAIVNQGFIMEFLAYYVNGLEMKMYGHCLHLRIDHHTTGDHIPAPAPYDLHIPE